MLERILGFGPKYRPSAEEIIEILRFVIYEFVNLQVSVNML